MRRRWMLVTAMLPLAAALSFAANSAETAVYKNIETGELMFVDPLTADERLLQRLRKRLEEVDPTRAWVPTEPGIPDALRLGDPIPSAPAVPAGTPAPAAVSQATHAAPSPGFYRVTKPVYTLRKDARADSAALATLRQGQDVTVLWFAQGGQWARVRLGNGKEGYVHMAGLVPSDSTAAPAPVVHQAAPVQAPAPAPAPATGTYRVTRLVNFRLDARATSQSLGLVKVGQEVTVLWFTQGGEWARVRLSNGLEGYVHATALQKLP